MPFYVLQGFCLTPALCVGKLCAVCTDSQQGGITEFFPVLLCNGNITQIVVILQRLLLNNASILNIFLPRRCSIDSACYLQELRKGQRLLLTGCFALILRIRQDVYWSQRGNWFATIDRHNTLIETYTPRQWHQAVGLDHVQIFELAIISPATKQPIFDKQWVVKAEQLSDTIWKRVTWRQMKDDSARSFQMNKQVEIRHAIKWSGRTTANTAFGLVLKYD